MAISNNERRLIIIALLTAYGEGGAWPIAQMIHYLITALPGITWEAELRTQAAAYQPFIDSGLSIAAWCDEVMRQANLIT